MIAEHLTDIAVIEGQNIPRGTKKKDRKQTNHSTLYRMQGGRCAGYFRQSIDGALIDDTPNLFRDLTLT